MTRVRPYNSHDYSLVSAWWKEHGFPSMPEHKLPPFGFVVEVDGIPMGASWAYMCNGGTGVAMLEWTVSNPGGGFTAARSIKELLTFMVEQLNMLEYDVIMTATKHSGLIKLMEKVGFQTTDSGVTHLLNIKTS